MRPQQRLHLSAAGQGLRLPLLAALLLSACRPQPGVAPFADRAASPDAATPTATTAASEARILLLADLGGYLEPCGCVADMKGGLARTAGRIEALAAEGPTLLLDAGHTLPKASEARGARLAQTREKTRTVIDLLTHLGARTVVAPADAALLEALGEDGRPAWGPASLADPTHAVRAQLLPVKDLRVAVITAVVKKNPFGKGEGLILTLAGQIKAALARLEAPTDLRLLIFTGGVSAARRLAPSLEVEIDLIAVSGLDSVQDGDRARVIDAALPIVRPMSQGRGLALIALRVPPEAGHGRPRYLAAGDALPEATRARIARFTAKAAKARQAGDEASAAFYAAKIEKLEASVATAQAGVRWPAKQAAFEITFESIEASLPEAPWARERIRAYDQAVARANLAWSREKGAPCPAPAPGPDGEPGAHYLGASACTGCHAEATAFWKRSRHAAAWATLLQDQKTADLECVSCHLTGWQRDGGVCQLHRIDTAYGARPAGSAAAVQCEACHGPGSQHVEAEGDGKIRRAPPEGLCRTCHQGLHSPDFDFTRYRAKILGPGHGKPTP